MPQVTTRAELAIKTMALMQSNQTLMVFYVKTLASRLHLQQEMATSKLQDSTAMAPEVASLLTEPLMRRTQHLLRVEL